MGLATLEWLTGLAQETNALVLRLRQSLVGIKSGSGQGSGVVWNSQGLIVTNHHVATSRQVEITPMSGPSVRGTVIARDPHLDLAAIQIDLHNLSSIQKGDERNLRVGELLIAIGNPFGVVGTATLGIVSATGSHTWMGNTSRELLQADIELAPGNSGGPLSDIEGNVVGINSMVLSPGIAAAIPISVVRKFIHRLTQKDTD